VELHQLRCFVMVAEELHFGRAARRLFMTQPPLSRQIQLLERSLGVTLFERNNRQVRLTVAGQHFVRDARHVLAYTEQAGASARRLAAGEAGQLLLGFTAVSGYRLVPGLLAHAAETLPKVAVELQEMVSSAQVQALAARMLDIGFVRQAVPGLHLDYELICNEPMVVAMPYGHSLSAQESVPLQALDQQPFIMYSAQEGRYFYDSIVGLCASAGISPRYAHSMGQTHSVLGLVRAGLGIALVPQSAADLGMGQVIFRPLRDAQPRAHLYLATHRDNDNPTLRPFKDMALKYFSSLGAGARDSR
jgi:DNA-binding transcriptional LysR family regulator